jgi:hypothetical protein
MEPVRWDRTSEMINRDPSSRLAAVDDDKSGAFGSLLVGLAAGAVLAALVAMALRCFG